MNTQEKLTNEWTKKNTIEPIKAEINSVENLKRADKEEMFEWLSENYDKIQQLLDEVDDEIDLKMSLAVNYIQTKSQWIIANTFINYSYMRGVEPEARLIYRATTFSKFLKMLEQFIDPDDLKNITDFLSKPVSELEY